MKHWMLLLMCTPGLVLAQHKKKKAKLEAQENITVTQALQQHVQYLSSLQGSNGEEMALQYIIKQYQQMGLQPKGADGFVQEFEIDAGKQFTGTTFFSVNEVAAQPVIDYFPLAFSATNQVKGAASVDLNEVGQPWFLDVKDVLEENQDNPSFNLEAYIKKTADKDQQKGATALLLFNSSSIADHLAFDKKDLAQSLSLPVLYITKEGMRKLFSDSTATFNLTLGVGFSRKIIKAKNIVAYLDNHAANTVVLGAHYDECGTGEGSLQHNIGADDNASGTAALIELARMLKKYAPSNNNYLIIHFSGEQEGRLGSKYWVEHPTIPGTPNYMVNFDKLGSYDSTHMLTISGYGTSPVWGNLFQWVNDKSLTVQLDSSACGMSDHEIFYRSGIPVLCFSAATHDEKGIVHEWNQLNYPAVKEMVQYAYHIIQSADEKGKLAFTKTTERPAILNRKKGT
ncbi:MAG: M28 family peptidase [Bacteroidota bacterium]|nr:M28 family peptidase [Bacteroidota bacterium]